MARPAESPINISSASPTPTRPTIPLPRRSSSRSRVFDLGPQNHVPAAFNYRNRNRANTSQPPVDSNINMDIPPPHRHNQPYVMMPSASSSRARPTGLALPGPSRPAAPTRRNTSVIDLTEEDEDEVEITGQYIAPAPDPGPARQMRDFTRDTPFPGDMDRLDRIVDDRRRATQAIIGDPRVPGRHSAEPPANMLRARQAFLPPNRRVYDERPHFAPNPPPADLAEYALQPPPPRQRIGLGGAVLRRGNQRINYVQPGPSGRVRPPPPTEPVPDIEEDRVRTRAAERIQQARRVVPHRHENMIAGIIQNMMEGMGGRYGAGEGAGGVWDDVQMPGGYPGMEEILRRLHPAGNPLLYRPGFPQGQQEDIQVITARAHKPIMKPVKEGYTRDFAIDDTIEIDQPRSEKKFLSCIDCGEPLLLNDGQKTPNDKIWSMRCGHFIHQKCLHQFSEPQLEQDRINITRPLEVLGAEENRRGKRQKTTKKKVGRKTNEPVEYDWECPVKGCGLEHVSLLKDAEWVQDEVEGAFQIYV